MDIILNGTIIQIDALRGVEIMFQFDDGGQYNTIQYPTVENASHSYYVAWWSPGQWVVPYIIGFLFSSGSVQFMHGATIVLCLLLSFLGFHRLFRKLEWNDLIRNITLFSIITSHTFYSHSITYSGGTTLLLAFFPWMILLLIQLKDKNWLQKIIVLFSIGLIGCFIKNTVALLLICSIAFLFINDSKRTFRNALVYIIPVIVVLLIVYTIHLRFGETPSSAYDLLGYGDFENTFSRDALTAIASPISLFTRLGLLDSSVIFGVPFDGRVLWFSALLTILLVVLYWRGPNPNNLQLRILLYLCFPFFGAITLMYFMDLAISYELRHFAPLAFLFFPLFVSVLINNRLKYGFIAIVFMLGAWDLSFQINQRSEVKKEYVNWKTMNVLKEEARVMGAIEMWETTHQNGLVLVDSLWSINVGIRVADKFVISPVDSLWRIESGMELDHPDKVRIQLLVEGYDDILTISKHNEFASTLFKSGKRELFMMDTLYKLYYWKKGHD